MFAPREVWVTANYKEVLLEKMRPGHQSSSALMRIRAVVFMRHVVSIQVGSGAAFSFLPPENATCNSASR
jgi:membrane fusion protein (multidrug efflux system)